MLPLDIYSLCNAFFFYQFKNFCIKNIYCFIRYLVIEIFLYVEHSLWYTLFINPNVFIGLSVHKGIYMSNTCCVIRYLKIKEFSLVNVCCLMRFLTISRFPYVAYLLCSELSDIPNVSSSQIFIVQYVIWQYHGLYMSNNHCSIRYLSIPMFQCSSRMILNMLNPVAFARLSKFRHHLALLFMSFSFKFRFVYIFGVECCWTSIHKG